MEKSRNSANHATAEPDWKKVRDFLREKAKSESLDVVEDPSQTVSSQDVADVLSLLGSYLHPDGNMSDLLVVETLVREYGWTVNRGVKALDRAQAWRLNALAATRMVEVDSQVSAEVDRKDTPEHTISTETTEQHPSGEAAELPERIEVPITPYVPTLTEAECVDGSLRQFGELSTDEKINIVRGRLQEAFGISLNISAKLLDRQARGPLTTDETKSIDTIRKSLDLTYNKSTDERFGRMAWVVKEFRDDRSANDSPQKVSRLLANFLGFRSQHVGRSGAKKIVASTPRRPRELLHGQSTPGEDYELLLRGLNYIAVAELRNKG